MEKRYNFYKFIGWSLIIAGILWAGSSFYQSLLLQRQHRQIQGEFLTPILTLLFSILSGCYFIRIGKKRKEKSKMIFLSSILTLPIIVVIVISLLLMWISVGISSSEDVSGFGLMIAWFLYPAAIFSYLISLLILIGNWLNQRRKKFKKLESFYFKDKSRRKNTKNIKQYFNKRISTQTAFFVIILLVFIIGIGTWYLVKYEYPGNEPSPITTAKPMEVNSEFNNCGQIAEEMNESTDKLKALANSLTEITQLYCVDTNIEERQLTEEYSGFPWIDQNKEIELIKGYQWYIFGTPGDYSQSVIDNCINTITVCLEENFVSNTENTDIDEKIFSFERGDIKCVFRIQPNDFQYFELSCGDITKNTTPVFYREIYNFLNSAVDLSKRVEIIETEGNFAIANTGTGYGYFLLKKVGDKWIEVTDLGEAEIDCDIVFNYGVPPSLVNNICIYYKTTREVWRHNEDSAKWEKWYNLDNPQDKK
jgi:hypothetical protein